MSYIIVSRERHITRYYAGYKWSDRVGDAITFETDKKANHCVGEFTHGPVFTYHVCELLRPDIDELINL